MTWLRQTIPVRNAEVVFLVAVVTLMMTLLFLTMTDNDRLRARFDQLTGDIDAKCVQYQDGSGRCDAGAFSGVGVTP